MNSFSIADELDQAVDRMLVGAQTTEGNADLEVDELMALASELQFLPGPEFKAQLKLHLTGQTVSQGQSTTSKARPAIGDFELRTLRENKAPAILPMLFAGGLEGYPLQQRNLAASLFMHVTALALVVVSGVWAAHHPVSKPTVTTTLILPSDYLLPPALTVSHGGGSGGDRDRLKASQGAPPPFSLEQLTPPGVIVRNQHPVLPTDASVIGPPEVIFPKTQMGDLDSKLLIFSNGSGFGGGIGDNRGTGVGRGDGMGVGQGLTAGIGGGLYGKGGGVTAPRPIYEPEPEYTDEARRAKFQGDVMLWVVIGPDGAPRDIRIQRSLGMGLDEQAVAAVKNWRFQPATRDGKPVAVQVSIEVKFRLF